MKVGDKVFLKTIGNAARSGVRIYEEEITKIGRKYITIGDYGQFEMDSRHQKSDYSPNYKFYLSREEIQDELEYDRLLSKTRQFFSNWGKLDITLEQLKAIDKILES